MILEEEIFVEDYPNILELLDHLRRNKRKFYMEANNIIYRFVWDELTQEAKDKYGDA